MRCNEAGMERTLLLAGAGIARVPAFAYTEELARGELVRVLAKFEQPDIGVHVIYPNREYLPAKTRAMADFMIMKASGYPGIRGRLNAAACGPLTTGSTVQC